MSKKIDGLLLRFWTTGMSAEELVARAIKIGKKRGARKERKRHKVDTSQCIAADVGHYRSEGKPPFDADEVRRLIQRFEQVVQHQAGWYTPYSWEMHQKETDDIRTALLDAIGLGE